VESRRAKRRRRLRLLLCAAVCFLSMYAPFSWLFWIDYSWGTYRWSWVKMYGGLPALLPGYFVMQRLDIGDVDDGWGLVLIHVVSIAALLVLTWLTSRRWWLFWILVPLLLFFSILNGVGAYHAFRM